MNERTLIGLMSGSSLDGLDIICTRFWYEENILRWEQLGTPTTVPYSERIYSLLKKVHLLDETSLQALDMELGEIYGNAVKEYVQVNGVRPDAIASHGHTVRHHPEKGFSLQIGSGEKMAAISGLPSITQFRTEDIKQGGQGAPLAPVVEHYLFEDHVMFLNLGGIANISLHTADRIVAYDICPANQLLNQLANQLGIPYDDKGAIASAASPDAILVDTLHQDLFHALPYPKSLDNNYVRNQFLEPLDQNPLSIEVKLASCVKYIAECIGKEINDLSKQHKGTDVLVTGGGAYNEYLLTLLQLEIGEVQIVLPSDELIQQKESLLMALCGYLFLENKPNSFASATGAAKDTVNGVIHYPE